MNIKQIEKLFFTGKVPLLSRLVARGVDLKKKLILFKRGPFKGLNNIEGLIEYDIDASCFDPKKKKHGLSAFGRLRNGAEFLEMTIESHIPFCDEIVLVDNNSEDNTRDICQKMQQKYPEKIKIFQYKPEVHKLGSQEYKGVPENSVHCMSYYYNRVLSKTSYSHCIKLDDDHLLIPENFEQILTSALKNNNTFFSIPLLNIASIGGEYCVYNKFPFAGLYGDFGIFLICKKTYFIKDTKMENFLHPHKTVFNKVSFFHTKFLKKYHGLGNCKGAIRKKMANILKDNLIVKIPYAIKNQFISLYYSKDS